MIRGCGYQVIGHIQGADQLPYPMGYSISHIYLYSTLIFLLFDNSFFCMPSPDINIIKNIVSFISEDVQLTSYFVHLRVLGVLGGVLII